MQRKPLESEMGSDASMSLGPGETLDDYVTLKRVEPAAYRVFFGEKEGPASLDLLYDVQAMCTQLEKVEVGASAAFLCFLSRAKEALDKVPHQP